MAYEAISFENLLGTPGLSDEMLTAHFSLYQGYVANVNTLLERLYEVEKGSPEFAELKRRFGWEFNGMRLHELYFGNIAKDPKRLEETTELKELITSEFGSLETFENEFRACAAMRGIGWVVLAHDKAGNRLLVTWINEHDLGHLAGATPLAVMDVFEHAYMRDYGIKRADYISAFWKLFDWSVAEARLHQ